MKKQILTKKVIGGRWSVAGILVGVLFLLFTAHCSLLTVQAQATDFTYQGRLLDNALPPTANYDFQFSLWDGLVSPPATQQGSTQTVTGVAVANGIFTVRLNFGAQFTGAPRFLQIATRPAGGPSYTTLAPRQPITSSPYSIKSASSTSADGLSANCVLCVTDGQILSIDGARVTGTVANAANAVNATTATSATTAGNVTGVVAIANGGTGSATKNFVDLSTDQTNIGGNKTFTGNTVSVQNDFVANTIDTDGLSVFGNGVVTGNLGIGTNSPAGKFHINVPGSGNPISALTLDVGTFGTGENSVNSYFFKVRDLGLGGTPAFLIRGDGNVGVATRAPVAKLHVSDNGRQVLLGGGNCGSGLFAIGFGSTLTCTNYAMLSDGLHTVINRPTGGFIAFRENDVPQVVINSGGNVGIGTTTPTSKLEVNGDIKATGTITGPRTTMVLDSGSVTPGNPSTLIPGLSQTVVVSGNAKLLVHYNVLIFTGQCIGCLSASVHLDVTLDGGLANNVRHTLTTGFDSNDTYMTGSWLMSVGAGTHTVALMGSSFFQPVRFGCGPTCATRSSLIVQVIPE